MYKYQQERGCVVHPLFANWIFHLCNYCGITAQFVHWRFPGIIIVTLALLWRL